MTPTPATTSTSSLLGFALAHAAFLACSWTWCIGMFLPVLLVRDFGFAGWLVFAVPNVFGAAAMGCIPRSDRSLEDVRIHHRSALKLFSLVTIAFHLFFNGWIIRRLLPDFGPFLTIALAILIYYVICPRSHRDLLVSLLVLALSGVAMLLASSNPDLEFPPFTAPPSISALLSLASACFFGFLLCPYLDLTFHRARQSAGPIARSAFALGFAVFFLFILIFSLRYATGLAPIIDNRSYLSNRREFALILGLYFSLQSAFTIAVHTRELLSPSHSSFIVHRSSLLLALAAFLIPMLLAILSQQPLELFRLPLGELFYRLFMSFYALYFPAYVYLRIIPPRSTLPVYVGTVVLATPLFFAAFILNHMIFLLPALAIILLAKLLPLRPSVPSCLPPSVVTILRHG